MAVALTFGCYSDDILATRRLASDAGCLAQLRDAIAARSETTCAALAAPTGPVTCVGPEQAAQLHQIVAAATAGTTLVLADGTYKMTGDESTRTLAFRTPGVTLRSASADAERVILDGEYATEELLRVVASDITISDVTLQHALHHGIHVAPPAARSIQNVTLHRIRVVDIGNRLIKVDRTPGPPDAYVDGGRLTCSTLELSAEGREHVQPGDVECDTGGLNASYVRGWTVSDSTFRGIYCPTGGVAQHAIHFWSGSRDTLVERNRIVDCARGIGFGGEAAEGGRIYDDDPYPGIAPIGHFGGIARNNFIFASAAQFDTGIELAQARGTKILHNSIFHPDSAFSSLDYRFANTLVEVKNNILVRSTSRDQGQAVLTNNLEAAGSDLFVDAASADLHLLASAVAAIDVAAVVPDAGTDIDGSDHARGPPDIGADELGAP
jgi:hypothetical protein